MPGSTSARPDPWSAAVAHLRQVDRGMDALIERVGPCALRPRKDRFGMLVRSIVGQQISSKAAAAINQRLLERVGGSATPVGLITLGEPGLRGVGVSGVKARYILNLCEAVDSGQLPLGRIGRWDDATIIDHLTMVKGIGVWTAEMFLMFALNRPDVLPVTDLGIRVGLREWHGLAEVPAPQRCRDLAEPWRPYRTVACWYLWRSRDTATPATPISANSAPPALPGSGRPNPRG